MRACLFSICYGCLDLPQCFHGVSKTDTGSMTGMLLQGTSAASMDKLQLCKIFKVILFPVVLFKFL